MRVLDGFELEERLPVRPLREQRCEVGGREPAHGGAPRRGPREHGRRLRAVALLVDGVDTSPDHPSRDHRRTVVIGVVLAHGVEHSDFSEGCDVLLDGGEREPVALELLDQLEPGHVVGGVVARAAAADAWRCTP